MGRDVEAVSVIAGAAGSPPVRGYLKRGAWRRIVGRPALSSLVAVLLAGASVAQPVPLPAGAVKTFSQPPEAGSHDLPTGPYSAEAQPSRRVEGVVSRWAYRMPLDRVDEFALFTTVRDTLGEAGFIPLFQCSDTICGGFDFRFGIEVLPPPEMEVDLEDFHFAAFERLSPDPAHLTLLVSRSGSMGYVQIIQISGAETDLPLEEPPVPGDGNSDPSPAPLPPSDWSADLATRGRAVLEGVNFETGQARLTEESGPVLEALAEFLIEDPDLSLLIVGHSDNTGSLEANIALSRSRAEAVRQGLVTTHGIDAGRLSAAGAGFLAPRAPNTTEEGQARNRRVEIVLQ